MWGLCRQLRHGYAFSMRDTTDDTHRTFIFETSDIPALLGGWLSPETPMLAGWRWHLTLNMRISRDDNTTKRNDKLFDISLPTTISYLPIQDSRLIQRGTSLAAINAKQPSCSANTNGCCINRGRWSHFVHFIRMDAWGLFFSFLSFFFFFFGLSYFLETFPSLFVF